MIVSRGSYAIPRLPLPSLISEIPAGIRVVKIIEQTQQGQRVAS